MTGCLGSMDFCWLLVMGPHRSMLDTWMQIPRCFVSPSTTGMSQKNVGVYKGDSYLTTREWDL